MFNNNKKKTSNPTLLLVSDGKLAPFFFTKKRGETLAKAN